MNARGWRRVNGEVWIKGVHGGGGGGGRCG